MIPFPSCILYLIFLFSLNLYHQRIDIYENRQVKQYSLPQYCFRKVFLKKRRENNIL